MARRPAVSLALAIGALASGCAADRPPARLPATNGNDSGALARAASRAATATAAKRESRALLAAMATSVGGVEAPIEDATVETIEPIAALVRDPAPEAAATATERSANRLPPESIRRVVRQNAGRFRGCQQRPSRAIQRVVVRFVIGPDGLVSRAEEESASFGDQAARRCILESFFALRFPNPPGQRIVVRYPLRFTQQAVVPLEPLPRAQRAAEPPPPGFEAAMLTGQRVSPPPELPEGPPPREQDGTSSRCPPGDPLCSEL